MFFKYQKCKNTFQYVQKKKKPNSSSPSLEVLGQIHLMFITTPTAHCLCMTKFLRRPYAVFIIATSPVFPGSLEKVCYKTSPLSGLILLH